MLPRIFRIKLLKKIAQTPPNLPTSGVSQTTVVSGSPPSFIASSYYPSTIIAFQAKNIPWINGLANLLNIATYYSSNGQVNLSWMRSNNFNFSTDQVPSTDLKNLMVFSKLVYGQLFTNSGAAYQQPLTPQEISDKIKILNSSQALNNLSAVQPTSQLSTKIGGNLRELIKNYLLQIK